MIIAFSLLRTFTLGNFCSTELVPGTFALKNDSSRNFRCRFVDDDDDDDAWNCFLETIVRPISGDEQFSFPLKCLFLFSLNCSFM